MSTEVWIKGEQDTVPELLARRLATDPDSEYLDVAETKLAARGRRRRLRRRRLAGPGGRARRPGGHPGRELRRSGAGVVRHGVGGHVAVPVNTAYKGQYLRHQLQDSSAKVLMVEAGLAERAGGGRRPQEPRAEVVVLGDGEPQTALAGVATDVGTWASLLTAPNDGAAVDVRPVGPRAPSSTRAAPPARRRAAC